MYRLVVDLQVAASIQSGHRGLGRYGIEFTRALLRNGANIDGFMVRDLVHSRLPDDLLAARPVSMLSAASIDEARSRGPLAYQLMAPMEGPYDIDMVLPRCIDRADALVMVVYDLIPLLFSDPYLLKDNMLATHVARLRRVKTADLLLAISERTRLDFIEHLGVEPERIVTIGTGASEFLRPPEPGEQPAEHVRAAFPAIRDRYIMCVPAFEWRKNAECLIRAFALTDARRDCQLVIACAVPPHGEAAWRSLAAEVGLAAGEMVITGFVDDALLRSLYQATELNVFPSRYEGFGLPVIEAARCGAPSISSDRGSLPEVLELPESTFDPDDSEALAALIDRALTDTRFKAQLLDAAQRATAVHTWDNTARRAIGAYARLPELTVRRPVRRLRRARVAIVGPMPPVPSGVAVYTQRVLDAIDPDRFDLDVYAEAVEPGRWPVHNTPRPYRMFPAAALGVNTNPGDYDAIVYCIGSSRFHVDTFDRLRRFPGIVWAHDINLVGLLIEWAARVEWELRYGWRGERCQTTIAQIVQDEVNATCAASPASRLRDCETYDDYLATGVTFAPSIAAATRIIVNSARARDLFVHELERAGTAQIPALRVLPHAVPAAPMLQLGRVAKPARPVVVSLGFTVSRKQPLLLVSAIAKLARPVDLVFVGSCVPEQLVRDIRQRASELGVGEQVAMTGFVDEEAYGTWLSRAACAVQLREIDFGESTGTAHDAIGAEVPVITSVRSCAELPSGVVTMVDPLVDADQLAREIGRLVFDDGARRAMQSAQRAYAQSWSFQHVAEQFSTIVEDAIAPPSRSFVRSLSG